MKFELSVNVISGNKGTITEQTDRKTGEITQLKDPFQWANIQAIAEVNESDTNFGYRPLKLPCTHEVFDQIKAAWSEKNKIFKVTCEMRSVADRNGNQKMTPFAIGLVSNK